MAPIPKPTLFLLRWKKYMYGSYIVFNLSQPFLQIDELEHDLRDLIKENQKLVEENAQLTDETQVKDEKIKELESRLDAKERLITELEKAANKMAG